MVRGVLGLGLLIVMLLGLSACDSSESMLFRPAVSTLITKARGYKEAGDLTKALSRLEAAQELSPESSEIAYDLGVIYLEQNRLTQAIASLEQAEKYAPDNVTILYTLGNAYAAKIEQTLQQAKASPKSPAPDLTSDKTQAIAVFEQFLTKASDSDPGRDAVNQQLGWLKALP